MPQSVRSLACVILTCLFSLLAAARSATTYEVWRGNLHIHSHYSNGGISDPDHLLAPEPYELLKEAGANNWKFLGFSEHGSKIDPGEWQALKDLSVLAPATALRGFEWTPVFGPSYVAGDHINVFGTTAYTESPLNEERPSTIMEALFSFLRSATPDKDYGSMIVAQFNHIQWMKHLPSFYEYKGNYFNYFVWDQTVDDFFCLAEVEWNQDIKPDGYYSSEMDWQHFLQAGWHVSPTIGLDNQGDIRWWNTTRHTGVWINPADMTANWRIGLMKALKARRTFASEDADASLNLQAQVQGSPTWSFMGTIGVPLRSDLGISFGVTAKDPTDHIARVWLQSPDGTANLMNPTTVDPNGFTHTYSLTPQDLERVHRTRGNGGEWCFYARAEEDDGDVVWSAPIWLKPITHTAMVASPASGAAGQSVRLAARLQRYGDNLGLSGRSVAFRIDGIGIGQKQTDADGVAALDYTLPGSLGVGAHTWTASYAGSDKDDASESSAPLSITGGRAVVYVNARATGITHDGAAWSTAYLSVQQGIDAATPDGEVWVAAGTYTGGVTLTGSVRLYGGFNGTETARAQRNRRANPTILSGSFSSYVVNMYSDAGPVLDGFHLRNAYDGVYVGAEGATITNNVIYACTDAGVMAPYSSTVVANNIFLGNATGICSRYGDTKAINNTLIGNGTGVSSSYASDVVANNLFYGNHIGFGATADCTVSHNAYFNNGINRTRSYLSESGAVLADPLLAGTTWYTAHLQPSSPCREAGDDTVLLPGWSDMDGETRKQGLHVDIGADESTGAAWSVLAPVIIRVSPGGSDANNGLSWPTARRSLQSAVDTVSMTGGEVWVAAGTYTENVSLPMLTSLYGGFNGTESTRTQRNANAYQAVISGAGTVALTICGGGTVDGFAVMNGGIHCLSGTPTISHNLVSGSFKGINVDGSPAATLANNVVYGNENGISVGDASVDIVNSTIVSNATGVVNVHGAVRIINDTITSNSDGIDMLTSAEALTVANSILAYNGTAIYRESGSYADPVATHSCFFGNGKNADGLTDLSLLSTNLRVNPKLAGRRYAALHIQPDSPCRNAGDGTAVQAGWTDMDGQARVQGGQVDIGADESDGLAQVAPAAAVVRISTSGNDANDGGSWTRARRTIQSALLKASATGGEVWAAAGSYTEHPVLPPGTSLYGGFKGTETDRAQRSPLTNVTTIVGTGEYVAVMDGLAPGVTLDGFRIIGRNSSGIAVYAGYSSSPVISGNRISGTGAHGIFVAGTGASITANTVRGMADGITLYHGAPIVHSNLVQGNRTGVNAFVSKAAITNNTIVANDTGVEVVGDVATLMNNIIAFNGTGVEASSFWHADPVLVGNCFFENSGANGAGTYVDTYFDNIAVNPLFVDRAGGDYHLSPVSPCVDAGINSAIQPAWLDLDGQPRLKGVLVDLGAYETSPSSRLYTLPDVVKALRVSAGLDMGTVDNLAALNVERVYPSNGVVDICDALRAVRKVRNRDPNP